jgi:hypothetical protein
MGSASQRADAFLDGEHFAVMVKTGQAPVRAVNHALNRRLKSDVTMWPQGRTSLGESFIAKWFDKDKEVFREGNVEIWNLFRRSEQHADRRRSGNQTPPTLTIRGRSYRVETTLDKKDEKLLRYILHGARGAKYSTMRNLPHPDRMFIVNERGFGVASVMDGVWLTDKDGTLRVLQQ